MLQNLTMLGGGFAAIANLQTLYFIIGGTLAGIILGAIPGLTGAMGIALLVPVTFSMPIIPSICMLLGVYCGGTYGGSLTAILINTPGSGASCVTAYDGYPLAKKGKAGRALRMALYASVCAGLISALLLVFVSPILASVATRFGPCEYLALILLGLTVVAGISGDNIYKGIISGAVGLLLACVGQDPYSGQPRLIFGNISLLSGLDTVALLIGLFAVSEILTQAEKIGSKSEKIELPKMEGDQRLPMKEFATYWKTVVKSSLMGAYIGAVPGIGASVASFVAYNEAIRVSKNPERYGKGELDGIAACEAGNNGVTGATLIPLLTLGIPGDVVTGILLGAFMMNGLSPGPLLFSEHGEVVYAIFAGLIVVNIVMGILGMLGMRIFPLVSYIPGELMFPVIFVMCAVGAYSSTRNYFQLAVIIAFGVLGYTFKKCQIPSGAFLIAYMLGNLFESNLQRTMIVLDGKLYMIFTKPIAVVFIALTALSIFYVIRMQKKKRDRAVVE